MKLKLLGLAVLGLLPVLAAAQKTTAEGIAEYRAMLADGNPAELYEAKGEALVLLAAIDLDAAAMRKKLADSGVPNLWIPRIVKRVDAIPILASGKLDLQKCKELALTNSVA